MSALRNVTLEPHGYRTRVWCDGAYLGSLFKYRTQGPKNAYEAGWSDGAREIERLRFSTRKAAVEYLIGCAEARGDLK